MKYYFSFALFVASFVVSKSQFSGNPCGVNEVFRFCGPPVNCQQSCPRIFRQNVMPCIPGCRTGCTCRPGYVRNSMNLCVHPSDCFLNKLVGMVADTGPSSLRSSRAPIYPIGSLPARLFGLR